jgi:hypothetical protein
VLFVTFICLLHVNCQENSITVRNTGGYVARFKITFLLNGKVETHTSARINIHQSRSLNIPDNSTNVNLIVEYLLISWRNILRIPIQMPSGARSFHVWGTTSRRRWAEYKA